MIKCKLEIEGYIPNPLDGPRYAGPPMPMATQSVSQGADAMPSSTPSAAPLDNRPILKLLLTSLLPLLLTLLGGKVTGVDANKG